MNNFEISLHAKEQADEREISVETIFDVLKTPDKVEVEENGQFLFLFHRLYDGSAAGGVTDATLPAAVP